MSLVGASVYPPEIHDVNIQCFIQGCASDFAYRHSTAIFANRATHVIATHLTSNIPRKTKTNLDQLLAA
jgi:hypothetical protein